MVDGSKCSLSLPREAQRALAVGQPPPGGGGGLASLAEPPMNHTYTGFGLLTGIGLGQVVFANNWPMEYFQYAFLSLKKRCGSEQGWLHCKSARAVGAAGARPRFIPRTLQNTKKCFTGRRAQNSWGV